MTPAARAGTLGRVAASSHLTQQALVDPFLVAFDFETLALGDRAAIVGAAAASFGEPSGPELLFSAWPIACGLPEDAVEELEAGRLLPPELLQSDQAGRHASRDTLAWHREQATWPTTRLALLGEGPELSTALDDLLEAIRVAARGRPVLWHSRPGAFDGAILLDLARRLAGFGAAEQRELGRGMSLHRRVRCLRTLQAAASYVEEVAWRESERPHDPTSDVAADAASADDCMRTLRRVRAARL